MTIAFLADIHANREALEACLSHARAEGAKRFVFLGDYVGYGAEPEWVVERIMDEVARGAVALLGNHDAAVTRTDGTMDVSTETAIEWTRGRLPASARAFLATLPLTVDDGDRLYVHAEAAVPASWTYVMDSHDAIRSIESTTKRLTFTGHVHRPAIYNLSMTGKVTAFRPSPGVRVPLLVQRRWLSVIGSVGQPRDGDPAACYALFDETTSDLAYFRVPYDVDAAARKIREAGLPEPFAARLALGR